MKRKYISSKIKAELQKEINSKCTFCNSEDIQYFEVHHIDGNCGNNEYENLILICPTCHSKIEKGDITTARVKEIKASLSKTKAELSAIELAELARTKIERERNRYNYLNSDKMKDDILAEWKLLVQIVKQKCDSIRKSLGLDFSEPKTGNLKVSLSRVYILIEFYPKFEEYQLSCTFNKSKNISARSYEDRYKFIEEKYLFDVNDNGDFGWNNGNKFYTSDDLAEYLLKELIKVNSDIR